MAHEVESIAWAHEVPWHGLGNKVEGNVTCDEMLVAAGLDWTVEEKPAFINIDGNQVPIDRKALVRSTDKKILTITGKDWKPFQNKDVMEFFREYTNQGGCTLETAGSLRGGKIVWALARVAAGFSLQGRDHVKAYLLLVSPHEVGKASTVRTTSVRVLCANTLAMAGGVQGKNAEYRQSHIYNFDTIAAKASVQLVKDEIAKMELDANALQQLKMSQFDTLRVLAEFFQPAPKNGTEHNIEELINEPDARSANLQKVLWATEKAPGATPGNGWGVLNGVTYWADHMAGNSKDSRLFNSWLGETGKKKDQVKGKLMEMVS
jgi:phage/plasmid-like protein (TIGR03299 family)